MSVCVVGEVPGVGAVLTVKLVVVGVVRTRVPAARPAAAGPVMNIPAVKPWGAAVVIVVEPVVSVQEATESGAPCTELPTVNLLTSDAGVTVTVVVAFSAQPDEPLSAKLSATRVT